MTASMISQHFLRDCQHYAISCPKCSLMVLCSDVCIHLSSDCHTKFLSSDCAHGIQSDRRCDKSAFVHFKAASEKQATEISEFLQRVVLYNATHEDRINKILQGVMTLTAIVKREVPGEARQVFDTLNKGVAGLTPSNKDVKKYLAAHNVLINDFPKIIEGFERALRDELAFATTRHQVHVSQAIDSLIEQLVKNAETIHEQITHILRRTEQHVAEWTFFVPGVKALQEMAQKVCMAHYEETQVYLLGYSVLPAIRLVRSGTSVKLQAGITLCKGDMDDYVQWPFQHKVGLSVVHPKDGTMKAFRVGGPPTGVHFQRPTESRNPYGSFSLHYLNLQDLLASGYVENDTLLVKWELLP